MKGWVKMKHMRKITSVLLCVALILALALGARAEAQYRIVDADGSVALLSAPGERARQLEALLPGTEVESTGRNIRGYCEVVHEGVVGFLEASVLKTPEEYVSLHATVGSAVTGDASSAKSDYFDSFPLIGWMRGKTDDDVNIVAVEPFVGTEDRVIQTAGVLEMIEKAVSPDSPFTIRKQRLDGNAVTRRGVKSLFDEEMENIDVLVWHGHGGFDEYRHLQGAHLALREKFKDIAFLENAAKAMNWASSNLPLPGKSLERMKTIAKALDKMKEFVGVSKTMDDMVDTFIQDVLSVENKEVVDSVLDLIPDFIMDDADKEFFRDFFYFCPSIEGDSWYYAITRYFVDDYVDLDNAMVYLATCHSGQTEALANAFIEAGADVVVYNYGRDNIDTWFDTLCMKLIFRYMTGNGPQIEDWEVQEDKVDPVCYNVGDALTKSNLYMMWYSTTEKVTKVNGEDIHWTPFTEADYSFHSYTVKDDNGRIILNEDGKPVVVVHDARPAISPTSDQTYTLFGGIKGILTSSNDSVDLDKVEISLADNKTAALVIKPDEDSEPDEGDHDVRFMYFQGLAPGAYTVEFRYKGQLLDYREGVEVDRHHHFDLGEVDLRLLELSPWFGGSMSDLARQIGHLRYRSGNEEGYEYWAEYANDAVSLSAMEGYANPNNIGWITLMNRSAGCTLFGIQPGMSQSEVYERMSGYQRLGEQDYYHSEGDCWCISRDDGYVSTAVEVYYDYSPTTNGYVVRSVSYGWFGGN